MDTIDKNQSSWNRKYEWKTVTLLSLGFGLVGLDRWIIVEVGAGEIFGGGVAPLIEGYIAENIGTENVLNLALAGVILGAIVSLFLTETAPKKMSKLSRAV